MILLVLLISISYPKLVTSYLNVDNNLAHERTEDPRVCDVPDDGWRRAEQHHENVGEGQIHDEDVGHALRTHHAMKQ